MLLPQNHKQGKNVLASVIKKMKLIKGIQIRMKKVKLDPQKI